MIKSRRQSRECALQILYQCDTLDEWTEDRVDLYFDVFQKDRDDDSEVQAEPTAAEEGNLQFCRGVVAGVMQRIEEIDDYIVSASAHWSIKRMSRIDRNILRIAVFEIYYLSDIPVRVSINEAIEVAKRYSSIDSASFVNGVLDKVASIAEGKSSADAEKKSAVND